MSGVQDQVNDERRAYQRAVEKYGRHSEEATDAFRSMRRAELELERQIEQVKHG